MGSLASLYAKLFGTEHVGGAIYDFSMQDIHGQKVDFEKYRGRKLLIVNTASKCGYTHQYADLEQLHREYGNSVTVLGFPSNNFFWQEPGSNSDILEFCEKNYQVSFKLFNKISVRGRSKHPLYKWLQSKTGKTPSWNFCKYLIDEEGKLAGFFGSGITPDSPEITQIIEK